MYLNIKNCRCWKARFNSTLFQQSLVQPSVSRHSYSRAQNLKRKRVYIANKTQSVGKTVPLCIEKKTLRISNSVSTSLKQVSNCFRFQLCSPPDLSNLSWAGKVLFECSRSTCWLGLQLKAPSTNETIFFSLKGTCLLPLEGTISAKSYLIFSHANHTTIPCYQWKSWVPPTQNVLWFGEYHYNTQLFAAKLDCNSCKTNDYF